ncbi:MAG: multicopper oxidase family protein [Shimia sp.]
MITRRDLLRMGTAFPALAALSARGAYADDAPVLTARPFETTFHPDLPPTQLWGFDAGGGASMPGPLLRGTRGEAFARTLRNDLPEATSVHWHGLRLPNEMDGVPGLTSPLIQPGETREVAFDLRDAGTYWYHSHQRSFEQVERGLHGALIVDESEGAPDVDADEVIVLDDMLLDPNTLQFASFGAPHDLSHGGRIGNVLAANGRVDLTLTARPGARLRLRLIAAQTARVFVLGLSGLDAWVVARDGQPLAQPERMAEDEPMGPGQRIDLIADLSSEGGAILSREQEDYPLVLIEAEGAAQAVRPAPAALPPNPGWALPDLGAAKAVALPLEGGAMGRLDSATLGGETMGFRALAGRGAYWAMAGRADMGDTPLVTAEVGETVRIDMDNMTRWPHAMHLHGYHFREVMPDGGFGPLRDTLLMPGRSQGSVAFVAESPGDWMVHCHMLGHAVSGMMTWLRVV